MPSLSLSSLGECPSFLPSVHLCFDDTIFCFSMTEDGLYVYLLVLPEFCLFLLLLLLSSFVLICCHCDFLYHNIFQLLPFSLPVSYTFLFYFFLTLFQFKAEIKKSLSPFYGSRCESLCLF